MMTRRFLAVLIVLLLPLGASALWDLPDGPFTYVDGGLDPASIEIDGIARPR